MALDRAAMIFPGRLRPELQQELGSDIIFHEAVLDEAVDVALEFEKAGVGVIISRGGTAEVIRQVVKIPVVNCEVTNSDLINTLLDIKQQSEPNLKVVALIAYRNMAYDVNQVERLLNIKVQHFWYWTDANELRERVRQVKEAGFEVVLGASMTVRLAEEFGIRGYLMQVGRETVRQAVEKAREILEIRRNDLARAERIKSILNFAHEGIVSFDRKGIVDFVNPRAENIFGQNQTSLVGRQVKDVFPGWDMANSNEIQLEQITKVGEHHIIYNRVPVIIDNQNFGGVVTFTELAEVVQAEEKIRNLLHTKGLVAKYQLSDIVGKSQAIKEAIRKAEIYGRTDSTVLITGETGTGKELFAHGLHQISQRRSRPFVAINCAALPENLLESELFGYEEGAFTGARRGGRAGLFELAHRGTLFLDEISEMPISLQARLLRAIQEKEVMRLGGDRITPIDVRIIAATNRNLREAVERKEFRSDLYFRLNILQLNIPPLRNRKEDIPLLVEHFRRYFSRRFHRNVPPPTDQLKERMMGHSWPGNVRELEHLMERYALLVGSMEEANLIEELFEKQQTDDESDQNTSTDRITIRIGPISKMLDEIYAAVFRLAGENKSRAADILGVNRMTVAKWLERHNRR